MIAVKLIAVPVVIWLASYAGRRWGHRVSGLISGFPLIAAPIVLFLSFSAPRDFVADTAWFTMAAAPAMGVHCLVYAWLARLQLPRKFHWAVCLLSAWVACVATQWLLSGWVIKSALGGAIALAALLLAACLMPGIRGIAGVPRIPVSEIVVRMMAALAIAATVMIGAEMFGPRVSGILLSFPITASVLPVFTLYLYGESATIKLLKGFLTGLLGFVPYFCVFALLVEPLGAWPAFIGGALASIASVSLALGWQSMRKGRIA
jgi:hypothetical protein